MISQSEYEGIFCEKMVSTHENSCRICGNANFKTLLEGIKTESGEIYSLLQCTDCSFAFTHPLPSSETLKKYYEKTYWSRAEGGGAGSLLTALFKLRMSSIIRQMKKLLPKGSRILEWGAGNGDMMRLLNQNGFDCVEIDLYSVRQADDKLISATIHTAPFEKESFDAITCFHVLEHLTDPLESMKKALALLKSNGILVIEVPNIDSIGFKIFKKRWYPLDMPVHLNHFNLRSLIDLFKRSGNSQIVAINYFSHRASPSALVVSMFPFFSPAKVRQKYVRYPFILMLSYLFLQMLAYPFVMVESTLKKGSTIITFSKKQPNDT